MDNHSTSLHFSKLNQNNQIIAEYIWLGTHSNICSKTRTLSEDILMGQLPIWHFKSFSTNQGSDSEVFLKPKKVYSDPFIKGNNILVFCDTFYLNDQSPALHFRKFAEEVLDFVKEFEPRFEISHELVFYRKSIEWPLGFPLKRENYHDFNNCEKKADLGLGRIIMEAHYKACLYAGLNISEIDNEKMEEIWKFTIGPCEGADIGDQFWLAKYLLLRCAEMFDVCIEWNPQSALFKYFNEFSALFYYTTNETRAENGFEVLLEYQKRLKNDSHYFKDELNEQNLKWYNSIFEVPDQISSLKGSSINNKKACIMINWVDSKIDPCILSATIADITVNSFKFKNN